MYFNARNVMCKMGNGSVGAADTMSGMRSEAEGMHLNLPLHK